MLSPAFTYRAHRVPSQLRSRCTPSAHHGTAARKLKMPLPRPICRCDGRTLDTPLVCGDVPTNRHDQHHWRLEDTELDPSGSVARASASSALLLTGSFRFQVSRYPSSKPSKSRVEHMLSEGSVKLDVCVGHLPPFGWARSMAGEVRDFFWSQMTGLADSASPKRPSLWGRR